MPAALHHDHVTCESGGDDLIGRAISDRMDDEPVGVEANTLASNTYEIEMCISVGGLP